LLAAFSQLNQRASLVSVGPDRVPLPSKSPA
jgi:hypothetical protein